MARAAALNGAEGGGAEPWQVLNRGLLRGPETKTFRAAWTFAVETGGASFLGKERWIQIIPDGSYFQGDLT